MMKRLIVTTALAVGLLGGCGIPRTPATQRGEPIYCLIPEGCMFHGHMVEAGTIVGWTGHHGDSAQTSSSEGGVSG